MGWKECQDDRRLVLPSRRPSIKVDRRLTTFSNVVITLFVRATILILIRNTRPLGYCTHTNLAAAAMLVTQSVGWTEDWNALFQADVISLCFSVFTTFLRLIARLRKSTRTERKEGLCWDDLWILSAEVQ